MSDTLHEVYVIYYEGEPCTSVNKPAYLTRGTANKVISHRAQSYAKWVPGNFDENYTAERAKYSIEKYVREVVSGDE